MPRAALSRFLLAYRSWFRLDSMWEISLFMAVSLLIGFGLLAQQVLDGDTGAFDQAILLAFRSSADPSSPIGPPWLQEMARDVTALGSFAFLGFITIAVAGYLLISRRPALVLLVAVAVVGGVLISTLLKLGFDRPRPDIPHGARVFTASFPSGHAMLSAVTFLTLGALVARAETDRRLKAYFVSMALFLTIVVGVSRVYLGVHYPSDVLAGWCVGSAWAILCWSVALWLEKRGQER
jgi:undecaprenyl-diphosphatase